jgi:uncharacterized membrane protein
MRPNANEDDEMNYNELLNYCQNEIKRLKLGDSPTNCHGVAAYLEIDGVRLSDGVGLDVIVQTAEDADSELEAMSEWYAEVE